MIINIDYADFQIVTTKEELQQSNGIVIHSSYFGAYDIHIVSCEEQDILHEYCFSEQNIIYQTIELIIKEIDKHNKLGHSSKPDIEYKNLYILERLVRTLKNSSLCQALYSSIQNWKKADTNMNLLQGLIHNKIESNEDPSYDILNVEGFFIYKDNSHYDLLDFTDDLVEDGASINLSTELPQNNDIKSTRDRTDCIIMSKSSVGSAGKERGNITLSYKSIVDVPVTHGIDEKMDEYVPEDSVPALIFRKMPIIKDGLLVKKYLCLNSETEHITREKLIKHGIRIVSDCGDEFTIDLSSFPIISTDKFYSLKSRLAKFPAKYRALSNLVQQNTPSYYQNITLSSEDHERRKCLETLGIVNGVLQQTKSSKQTVSKKNTTKWSFTTNYLPNCTSVFRGSADPDEIQEIEKIYKNLSIKELNKAMTKVLNEEINYRIEVLSSSAYYLGEPFRNLIKACNEKIEDNRFYWQF